MYSLGAKSRAALKGVHPDLVVLARGAIAVSKQDFSVHDGVRTREQQQQLVKRGASKTMNSKHLPQRDGYGHAVDLVPYVNGQLRWEWGPIYEIASAMYKTAKANCVKLVWGGVWDRNFPEDFGNGSPATMKRMVDEYAVRERARQIAAGRKPSVLLDGPHFQLR